MKISLNWLKKYVDIKISDEELIKLIGARLVEVEGVIDETKKYDNIFAVKVIECEPIEGTHLHLCKVDVGTSTIQVVCGAPNVRAGMLAAWIAPGAIVPASVHEDAPFVIGTRKMLGQYESHGMLAGADELDFGDDHSGIVELDPAMAQPGDKLADIFELNDKILEIENKSLTHRPDCFGMIGFAREVAGILGQKFNESGIFMSVDQAYQELKTMQDPADSYNLSVEITDPKICPYYSAAVLDFTRIPTTQKYLSLRDTLLSKSGMRPVSPIVDLTNYIMLLTGQPLHAFDYDKFVAIGKLPDSAKIIVRSAAKSEKLTLLDASEIELNENDIVITSNNAPVALAGAMGGQNTAIDENTKRIILESATFSLYNLRKTQMSHGIFSEAITRFTKGQPAANCLPVLLSAVKDLGGKILGLAVSSAKSSEPNVVKITTLEINALLGTAFSTSEIIKILGNVGIVADDTLKCVIPAWRTDIHIKEDIIEEVGRLSGYDNIPKTLPLHATPSKNPLLSLKSQIREILSTFRANELLTYTFVHGELLEKVGESATNSYRIINSISPDLQYVRQTILPSLMVKSQDNLKSHHDEFTLFEMNQVFDRRDGLNDENVPVAHNHLALITTSISEKTNFYLAKKYLEELFRELGVKFELAPAKAPLSPYFEPKRSAEIIIDGRSAGVLGEIKQKVLRLLKLPAKTAAFELDLDILLAADKSHRKAFLASDFPFVSRDLTIAASRTYAEIYHQITQILQKYNLIFAISPVSIYQAADSQPKISFHLDFSDPTKTLDSASILQIMADLEKIH